MIRQITSYLPLLGILFLVATLPFPFGPVQRIALYVLAIGYVLDYVVNQRWKALRWTKEKWMYVAFILFFALTPIRQLFDSQMTCYFHFEMEHYMPFLIFGLVGILGVSDKLRVRYLAYVMLLVCLGIFGYVLYQVGFSTFFESTDRVLIFNVVRREINSHMVINLYCNTALICGGYTILQRNVSKMERILTGIACCLVFLFVMLSEGRIGVATTCALLVLFVVYASWNYQRKLLLPMLILCVSVSGYFISTHDRMQHKRVVDDPRMEIWAFSWKMIKAEPVWGYGVSTYSKVYAEEAVKEAGLQSYLNFVASLPQFIKEGKTVRNMHPHNSFLKAWLEFGIFGPLILFSCFILPLVLFAKNKRFFVGLFLMVYGLQAMFDIMGIHIPVTLFVVVLLVFHYSPKEEGKELPACQPLANA